MECPSARKHLVKNCSERKDVRAMIDSLSADLFGRHVTDRADYYTGTGVNASRGNVGLLLAAISLYELGNSKVQNLHAAIFGDEDVLRLQVAMDDPFLVRSGQTMRNLDRIVDRFALRLRRAAQSFAQRLAFEQFRDDVRRTVMHANIVDGKNVGMVQRAGSLCFLLETPQSILIL